LLLLLIATMGQLPAQTAFGPNNPIPSSLATSTAVHMADMDGDYRSDVLVVDSSTGVLVILRRDGLGNTSVLDTQLTGNTPRGVTTSDLDQDGFPDVVVANGGDGTVSIYRNLAGASLMFAQNITVGSDPRRLTSADLNGDGLPDIIVPLNGQGGGSGLAYLRNLGGFNFAPVMQIPLPMGSSGPRQVVSFDYDQDGDLDLAVANFTSSNVVLLDNDGAGNFSVSATIATGSSFSTGLAAADFDGDGFTDLVAASFLPPNLAFLRNNLGIGFLPAIPSSVGVHLQAIAAGDVNVDGATDLVVCDASNNMTTVLPNNGSGGFAPVAAWSNSAVPSDVALGDMNGDFLLDVVSAVGGGTGLTLALNAHPFPVLSDLGRGTVTQGPSQYVDTLRVDGSTGGAGRRVDLVGASALFVSVDHPPLAAPGRPYVLWVMAGAASASTVTSVPLPGVGASVLRPYHLFPADPSLAVLSNGFFADGAALFNFAPTPSNELIPLPPGPFLVTVQGLVETSPGVLRLTNAVLVNVQ
jgi:hypothetical protein